MIKYQRSQFIVLVVLVLVSPSSSYAFLFGLDEMLAYFGRDEKVKLEVADLQVEAVRNGLTKQNIVDMVKTVFIKKKIKVYTQDDIDSLPSGGNEQFSAHHAPEMKIEVIFDVKGKTYRALIMSSWNVHSGDHDELTIRYPEVEAAMKYERELNGSYSKIDKSNQEELDRFYEKDDAAKEAVQKAVKRSNERMRNLDFPDRGIRLPFRNVKWERQMFLYGKLGHFAGHESRAIEDIAGVFLTDFIDATSAASQKKTTVTH